MNEDEILHANYYCCADVIRSRRMKGQPIPEWLRLHYRHLDSAVRMSQPRPEASVSGSAGGQLEMSRLIGASQAAVILGWKTRQVQRRATELGGELIDGRWLFHMDTIYDFRDRRTRE